MHQLVLITAMATTTGLFGGGKHCGRSQHCGRVAVAPTCYSAGTCGTTYASPYAVPQAMQQGYYSPSPQMVPAAPSAPGKSVPAAPLPPTTNVVPAGRSPFAPAGYVPVVTNGNVR
jgi:hypothetical protein